MALRNWNPQEPYVLGLEWPGMRNLTFPLTQEVEIGQTLQANATETVDTVRFNLADPTIPTAARATALVTIYRRDSGDPEEGGDELEYGLVTSQLVQPNGGTLAGGAALVGGASVAACLVTPSDSNYVALNGVGSVDVEFATAGLFAGKRILEVRVRFVAIESSVPTHDRDLGLLIQLWNGAQVDGGFPLIDHFGAPPTERTTSFGEVYYGSGSLPLCWPWTPSEIQAFDAGTLTVRFSVIYADHNVLLHSALLEVVWCEENRQAVAGLLLGSDGALLEESAAAGQHVANFRTPAGVDNWAKVLDTHYAATLVVARSSDLAVRQTKGVAPVTPAVDRFEIFDQHQGRVAPRLATNVLGSVGVDSRVTPMGFATTAPGPTTDSAPYDTAYGAPIYNASGTHGQEIEQRSGGGTVEYPWIRFYARIIGDPVDVVAIDITHALGAMNYFATSLLLLPEIFDGWREVTLRWPAGQEPDLDNSGTDMMFEFSTTQGNITNRWEILGLSAERVVGGISGASTYGQGDSFYDVSGSPRIYSDLAVTVHTEAPDVASFAGTLLTATLSANEGAMCAPTEFTAPFISWTASGLTDAVFGYYEVQRQDTLDPVWRTVAKLTLRTDPNFADMEARVGIATSYRVRIVRADLIEGDWSATEVETVPSTPNPCGTLYFSTNLYVGAGYYLGYAEVFTSSPEEQFGFVEAESVSLQRMYGRFGTQSFKPTERGGVRFERDIVVNALSVPDGYADEGFRVLRDLAWLDVPYICVKDDLGNRWYSTLIVPEGVVSRPAQLFIANIQVIQSTDVPYPVATQTA